jgi:hypothetical protein
MHRVVDRDMLPRREVVELREPLNRGINSRDAGGLGSDDVRGFHFRSCFRLRFVPDVDGIGGSVIPDVGSVVKFIAHITTLSVATGRRRGPTVRRRR